MLLDLCSHHPDDLSISYFGCTVTTACHGVTFINSPKIYRVKPIQIIPAIIKGKVRINNKKT